MGHVFSRLCLATFIGLCAGTSWAQDQWITGLPETIDLAPLQLFSIKTSGPPAEDGSDPIREFGTGFAIAPKVIITAKHVTRQADEFENKSGNDKIKIPLRKVVLSYTETEKRTAKIETNEDVWVTPSPLTTTDASRIDLDTLTATPFDLSVCAIQPGQQYYLLKFMQGEDGTSAKNIKLPTAVPITAHTDVASRLGNLRRFEVTIPLGADNLRKPIGGDSGSPILDGQGRVIGLLTALQGSYLWVTPTQAFFDLVPVDVKSRVACNSEVTFANLNATQTDLTAQIDSLDSRYIGLKERIDTEFASISDQLADHIARIAELEAQVAALEKADRILADTDTKLLEADSKLQEADTQLGSNLKGSTTVLTAMLMEAAEIPSESKTGQLIESLMQQMAAVDPVIPTVAQMKEDLGEPKWGFSINHNLQGAPGPLLNIRYERGISLPLVAEEIVLCLRPMYDFLDGVRAARHATLDYTNFAFYAESEYLDGTGQLLTECAKGGGLPQGVTKSAEYKMPINTDPQASTVGFEVLDTSQPPDRFFGYVFDKDNEYPPGIAENDKDPLPILHRFIFEVDRSAAKPRVSCYYFPEQDLSKAHEAVRLFLQATEQSEKDARRCPTV